jgi:hypothetical protein
MLCPVGPPKHARRNSLLTIAGSQQNMQPGNNLDDGIHLGANNFN